MKTKQAHFLCMFSKVSDEKQKNKETENIFYYGCLIYITFFFYLIVFHLTYYLHAD